MSIWDDPNAPSGNNAAQPGGSNFFGDLADPFAEPEEPDDTRTVDLSPARPAVPPTPETPPAPEPAAEEPAAPAQRDVPHLERLENEWRRLQRAFAYHPHVRVIALEGDPPDQYQIDYRFRTVLMDESGQLQYSTTCSVHIWLPPEFPHEPPLVRPVSDLFHPNVVPDGINIDRCWTSTRSTLVDVIAGVGAMLCYQDFDVENAWNPAAAEWTIANPRILPLDPDANLHPDAGGDPLQRICRHGPRTLEQTRQQLKQMCDSLLVTGQAPDDAAVRDFAEKTRQSLSLFIEGDIPEELRITVGDLDDFAGELPASVPCWEGLRRYRDNAAIATQTARKLRDSEKSIDFESKAIDGLVAQAPPSDPHAAMRALPPVDTLEMHQQNLEGVIARTDQFVGEARTATGRIEALPDLSAATRSSVLQKRLDAEIERARTTVAEARGKLNEALASLDPVLARGRAYAQALRRMIEWRSYADMVDRAEEFSHEVLSLGPAGTQAFFIENESGRFGPFELEQKLTLGSVSLIVRNPASSTIELIASDTGKTLVKSDEGKAAMPITDPESGAVFRTRFQLSGNCDELAVQLDYAARESTVLLEKLRASVRSPRDSWLGAFNDLLRDPAKMKQVTSAHDQCARRWQTIRDDLRSLRPFKERLATFRLIQHMHDWVAQMVDKSRADKKIEKETTERIAQIVAGCNTDMETGRLHIPQKYAKEYPALLDERDRVRHELAQLADHGKRAIAAIQARINNVELRGAAELPQVLLLGALPEPWPELVPQMSNRAIGDRLTELGIPLMTQLKPDGWPDDPDVASDAPVSTGDHHHQSPLAPPGDGAAAG
ncbi:MAG: hypothetical protein ACHRHE_10525 [Tepidisphaerales bacterium]